MFDRMRVPAIHVGVPHQDGVVVDDRHRLRGHLAAEDIRCVHDPEKVCAHLVPGTLQCGNGHLGVSTRLRQIPFVQDDQRWLVRLLHERRDFLILRCHATRSIHNQNT